MTELRRAPVPAAVARGDEKRRQIVVAQGLSGPASRQRAAGDLVLCKPERLCYTLPAREPLFRLFLGSSAVEHSTVNRMVAGSNPARGASNFNTLRRPPTIRIGLRFCGVTCGATLPTLENGPLRPWLLLASASLREGATAQDEPRLLDEEAPSQRAAGNTQASAKVRMACTVIWECEAKDFAKLDRSDFMVDLCPDGCSRRSDRRPPDR